MLLFFNIFVFPEPVSNNTCQPIPKQALDLPEDGSIPMPTRLMASRTSIPWPTRLMMVEAEDKEDKQGHKRASTHSEVCVSHLPSSESTCLLASGRVVHDERYGIGSLAFDRAVYSE